MRKIKLNKLLFYFYLRWKLKRLQKETFSGSVLCPVLELLNVLLLELEGASADVENDILRMDAVKLRFILREFSG